jgi:ABC-type oligopeptide transport system substrate-binding subunit
MRRCSSSGAAAIPTASAPWRGENYPGLRSQAVDQLLADAAATLERAGRAELLRRVEGALLAELPRLPLAAHARLAAFSPELSGLELAAPPIAESWNAHQWALVVR